MQKSLHSLKTNTSSLFNSSLKTYTVITAFIWDLYIQAHLSSKRTMNWHIHILCSVPKGNNFLKNQCKTSNFICCYPHITIVSFDVYAEHYAQLGSSGATGSWLRSQSSQWWWSVLAHSLHVTGHFHTLDRGGGLFFLTKKITTHYGAQTHDQQLTILILT